MMAALLKVQTGSGAGGGAGRHADDPAGRVQAEQRRGGAGQFVAQARCAIIARVAILGCHRDNWRSCEYKLQKN